MATWTNNNATYYINPAYLTFVENSGYGANLIQVSASSSCYISVYIAGVVDYSDADKNYRRWKITAYNNKFPDNDKFYIYVRLEKESPSALVIYDKVLRGVHGGEIVEKTNETGDVVREEGEYDPEHPYLYIHIGEVGETDGTSIRPVSYDTGYLTSNKSNDDKSGVNDMWTLDKYSTPWLIRAKHWLSSFTVKGFISLVGGLIFKGGDGSEKPVVDIKRSTDNDEDLPVSDDNLATSKYVEEKIEGMDERYLSKIKDDRTPFKINVGDKFTAEKDATLVGQTETDDVIVNEAVHSKEFISGFTGGKGWAIRMKEYLNSAGVLENRSEAEVDDLIVRGTLRVYEFIVSQLLGENDNRIFTAMLEVDHYDKSTGMVWLDTQGGKLYNPFRVDDIILVQQYGGMPSEENDYYITKQYELVVSEIGVGDLSLGEDRLDWVKFRNFSSPMEGATEELITKGDTFVRIDNLSNPDRKGIIEMMTVGADTPYMDVVYGKKTDPDNALKARFGNLQGIYSPLFGWLKDFGAYITNLYAVGEFRIAHTGEDVSDAIEMTKGAFRTNFKQVMYDMTEDDNLLSNGVFAGDLSMWQLGESTTNFLAVDGTPVIANRSMLTAEESFCGIDEYMGRNLMRIYDSKVTQPNSYIERPDTHKEYEEGEDGEVIEKEVPDKVYLTLNYYCRKDGDLWVGFTDGNGNPHNSTFPNTSVHIESGIERKSVTCEGEWDGTGNFTISTTGDVYVDMVVLTTKPLEDFKAEYSTRIEQDARRIALIAEKTTETESKVAQLEITADGLSSTVATAQDSAEEAKRLADAAEEEANNAYSRANSAYGLADSAYDNAATAIQQSTQAISMIAASFNEDGSLKNTSGLVIASDFTNLSTRVGNVEASISTFVTHNELGQAISNIQLTADKVTIYGETTINDIFKVSNGVITLGGFTVNNDSLTSTTTVLGSTMNMELSAKNINFMYSDGLGAGVAMEAVFGPTSSYFSNEGTITAGVKISNTAGKSSQQAGLLLNVSSGYNIYASGGSCFLLPSAGNLTRIQGLSLYGIRNTSGTLNSITDFILASGNVTLPAASTLPGKIIFVKMSGNYSVSSTSTIVKSSGSDTYTRESFNNRALFYISNGSRWYEFTCYSR